MFKHVILVFKDHLRAPGLSAPNSQPFTTMYGLWVLISAWLPDRGSVGIKRKGYWFSFDCASLIVTTTKVLMIWLVLRTLLPLFDKGCWALTQKTKPLVEEGTSSICCVTNILSTNLLRHHVWWHLANETNIDMLSKLGNQITMMDNWTCSLATSPIMQGPF